jgi:hypothetical protein
MALAFGAAQAPRKVDDREILAEAACEHSGEQEPPCLHEWAGGGEGSCWRYSNHHWHLRAVSAKPRRISCPKGLYLRWESAVPRCHLGCICPRRVLW